MNRAYRQIAIGSNIEYNTVKLHGGVKASVEEQSVITPEGQAPASSSLLREVVETILLATLVFLIVNAATGRFRIDGMSMEPTLHDGEYVIINRLVYKLHPPERGDVIVFRRDGRRDYIKRVIGLPGETIEIRRGQVLINGQALPESFIKEPGLYSMGLRTIEPNEYFVLGDNRNNSSDSHNWGAVPFSAIDGKAWIVYWPPQNVGSVPHYAYPALTP
jgi:signal peptidase I